MLFPVSKRGVVLNKNRVVLLHNERQEWELPGDRLEAGESPEGCVAREILEDLNLSVEDARIYEPIPSWSVVVLAYGCSARGRNAMKHSEEHSVARLFDLDELENIPMPARYARAVRASAESGDQPRQKANS